MDLPPADLLAFFYKLLPGFLAAAAFHALTPYPKRDTLDRVVAALIFTLFATIGVSIIRWCALAVGRSIGALGVWSDDVELGISTFTGLIIGIVWAHLVNNGFTHRWLHVIGTTKKTSLPSQWFGAFSRLERHVVLVLKDGRRLMGWPREWPDEPESGHFLLESPSWVNNDGSELPMHQIEALLVSATDVESVEFLRKKSDPELKNRADAIQATNARLLTIHKENADDKQIA